MLSKILFDIFQNFNGEMPTITPKWFQRACQILLSHLIIQPDGVVNIIRGVLDIGWSPKRNGDDNMKR